MSNGAQFDTDGDGSASARHHHRAKRLFRRAAEDFMRELHAVESWTWDNPVWGRLVAAWEVLERSR